MVYLFAGCAAVYLIDLVENGRGGKQLVLVACQSAAPHRYDALEIEAVLGERARLVEDEGVERAADVYGARTDAVDLLGAEAILGVDEAGGESAGQGGRHGDGDDVERALDDVADGALAHDLERGGEGETDKGDHAEAGDVLVDVVVEAEVDGLGVQNGAHQFALGRVEAGAQHDGAQSLVLVEAYLYDLGAAEYDVATVLLDAELVLLGDGGRRRIGDRGRGGDAGREGARVAQRRLGHRHRLARQHALVDDHVAVEQHGVALHHRHVLDGHYVAGHEQLALDLLFHI